MKRKYKLIVLWFALSLTVLGLMTGIGYATAGATTTPMLTWGYAQFIDPTGHGEPVPIGTEVNVYIGSDTTPSGSINVTTQGFYGSMMVVGDASRYGEELRYTLDGYATTKIGPDAGVFGLENQAVNIYSDKSQTPVDPVHTWVFTHAGFFPKHLPDLFMGTVNLSELSDVPWEIQGVYHFDVQTLTWLFWHPQAPGTTLSILEGGLVADYMVASAGACEWEIPLQ